MPAQGGIASIGELLVEFACAKKNGHQRVVGYYGGPYASAAPGIFVDQSAQCIGRCIFVGAVENDTFGDSALQHLHADGVDATLIATVSGKSCLETAEQFAASHSSAGARLLFLPAYSPDLNLISKCSQNSKHCFARPRKGPSLDSGSASEEPSALSPQQNAQTTS